MGIETIVAIAGTAIAAAGTGATVYQGQKQMRVAEKAADTQADLAARQRAELLERQKQEEASAAAKTSKIRQRQSGAPKGGTILTTPLGLPADSAYQGKTLLGGGSL